MNQSVLGIIGGSGVYDLPGIEDLREERIASPWGEPSDVLRIGRIGANPRWSFLPRHGRGHVHVAVRHQLPRQYRRAQAGRRHRPDLGLGLRLLQGRALSRLVRAGGPVRRPHLRRETRSSARAASPMCRWRIRSGRCLQARIAAGRASRRRSRSRRAAPTCASKARNSPPTPNRITYGGSATT